MSAPRMLRSGSVDVVTEASPEAVWDVVVDVTRIGEWSHECGSATWVGGATTAVPGARFRGGNKVRLFRWHRVSEVVTADRPREFAWRTIPTVVYRDSTVWRITIEPTDDGRTRITQSYEVVKLSPMMERFLARAIPEHRDRMEALAGDLRRLGEVAARSITRT